MAKSEGIEHSEERRLFYVALTRAKKSVYLINDQPVPSKFLLEMSEEKYPEVEHITPRGLNPRVCPKCNTGMLFLKKSQYGLFLGCTTYKDGCDYIENVKSCQKCSQGIMIKQDNKYKCSENNCDYIVPICRVCGSAMVLRNSKYGKFYGCSMYGSKKAPCSYTLKVAHFT